MQIMTLYSQYIISLILFTVGKKHLFTHNNKIHKCKTGNNYKLHLLLLIMALQLFMQSCGLLNQFLPSSSILDKGLPIWH